MMGGPLGCHISPWHAEHALIILKKVSEIHSIHGGYINAKKQLFVKTFCDD